MQKSGKLQRFHTADFNQTPFLDETCSCTRSSASSQNTAALPSPNPHTRPAVTVWKNGQKDSRYSAWIAVLRKVIFLLRWTHPPLFFATATFGSISAPSLFWVMKLEIKHIRHSFLLVKNTPYSLLAKGGNREVHEMCISYCCFGTFPPLIFGCPPCLWGRPGVTAASNMLWYSGALDAFKKMVTIKLPTCKSKTAA